MSLYTLDPLKVVASHANDMPVPVFNILSELGLGPQFRPLADNISGWIERRSDGKYWVVVNDQHAPVRQRFTAAHELGHYIYHRDLLGPGVGDTRAYRAEGTPLPNVSIRPVHERQANSFAANLLMPALSISRLRFEGVSDPHAMAQRLGVSEAAMRIRLGLPARG